MSALTEITIREMEDSERDILERMDERLARLDASLAADPANEALADLRMEAEMSRVSYEHQLALTRRVIERAMRAMDRYDERADERDERADERDERAAARDATRDARLDRALDRIEPLLDESIQAIRALRDALSGGNGPEPAT